MFSTEFLLTSLVVVLIPGTGVIYTVSTGLVRRVRRTLWLKSLHHRLPKIILLARRERRIQRQPVGDSIVAFLQFGR